jgi:dolichol kinase
MGIALYLIVALVLVLAILLVIMGITTTMTIIKIELNDNITCPVTENWSV